MRYRHFKGKEYTVLTVAEDSETLDWLVVYCDDTSVWVRPLHEFAGYVIVDGKEVRRFALLGEDGVNEAIGNMPTYAQIHKALEESVKLQSHYAELLNMHDGGERIGFKDASAWLARLTELKAKGVRT